MKIMLYGQANDGSAHYEAGAEVENPRPSFAAKMLVNGLADPLDDEAKALAQHPGAIEEFRSEALQRAGDEARHAWQAAQAAQEG